MSIIDKTKIFFKAVVDSFSQPDAGWTHRSYDFYLVFGQDDESKLPWIKSNWDKDFAPFIDLLLKQTEHYKNTGIRVTKYLTEKRIAKKDNKEFTYFSEIKLGRLRWDEKSHEKWTLIESNGFYFQDLELWSPVWTTCEKIDAPPDIFISIFNEVGLKNQSKIQFGYFMVIAVAKNIQLDSKPIINELSERINSKITVVQTRKWGVPVSNKNWTFYNGIQDTFSNGIYKGHGMQTINFAEIEFEPFFEVIYKQK